MAYDARRFGEQLLLYRRRKRLTQKQLAQAAGLHHSTIVRLERGQIPNVSLEVVGRLAQALDVSLDQLTGWFLDAQWEPATLAPA